MNEGGGGSIGVGQKGGKSHSGQAGEGFGDSLLLPGTTASKIGEVRVTYLQEVFLLQGIHDHGGNG